MSKITHTKKIIEYKYAFKGYFKVWHKVNDEIRTIISYIKDDLQISPKKNIAGKQKKGKSLLVYRMSTPLSTAVQI